MCLATNKRKWMETFFFRFNIVLMNYLSAKLLYESAISHAYITIFTFYILGVYVMIKLRRFDTRGRSLFLDYVFSIGMEYVFIWYISLWFITYALKSSFKRQIFWFLTFLLHIINLFRIYNLFKKSCVGIECNNTNSFLPFNDFSVPFE